MRWMMRSLPLLKPSMQGEIILKIEVLMASGKDTGRIFLDPLLELKIHQGGKVDLSRERN